LQTCPGSTPPSSFPHSHSSIPACMSRQPHTVSRPILTPTTACPAQLVHATTSQPSLHPQHHQPEQPWLRPRHLLHVPGIQHAQHPSPAPLNACTLQSMRVLTDSRNACHTPARRATRGTAAVAELSSAEAKREDVAWTWLVSATGRVRSRPVVFGQRLVWNVQRGLSIPWLLPRSVIRTRKQHVCVYFRVSKNALPDRGRAGCD